MREVHLEEIIFGLKLKKFKRDLRANKNIVMTAVKQNGMALEYALGKTLTDEKIVTTACQQNGLALTFIPKMANNQRVVIAAVKQNGFALELAAPAQANKKHVVCIIY